jgi:hypothetical protein
MVPFAGERDNPCGNRQRFRRLAPHVWQSPRGDSDDTSKPRSTPRMNVSCITKLSVRGSFCQGETMFDLMDFPWYKKSMNCKCS